VYIVIIDDVTWLLYTHYIHYIHYIHIEGVTWLLFADPLNVAQGDIEKIQVDTTLHTIYILYTFFPLYILYTLNILYHTIHTIRHYTHDTTIYTTQGATANYAGSFGPITLPAYNWDNYR
jgi:hypothetical protein